MGSTVAGGSHEIQEKLKKIVDIDDIKSQRSN